MPDVHQGMLGITSKAVLVSLMPCHDPSGALLPRESKHVLVRN